MNLACKMVAAYFDSQGLKYKIVGDEGKVIETGYSGLDNRDVIKVLIFFDDNNSTCALRSFDFLKFPAAKKEKMYEVCSKMNDQFRWVKFYVDERDNTITLSDDAVLSLDTAGEEIKELVGRMVSIGDDAYPEFMRAIYA